MTTQTIPTAGTVVHGTHRAEDLIPAFTDALAGYDPATAAVLREEYHDVFAAIADDALDRSDEILADNTDWLIDDLFSALDDVAPDGLHFGAAEGDGADFGFWPIDYPG